MRDYAIWYHAKGHENMRASQALARHLFVQGLQASMRQHHCLLRGRQLVTSCNKAKILLYLWQTAITAKCLKPPKKDVLRKSRKRTNTRFQFPVHYYSTRCKLQQKH